MKNIWTLFHLYEFFVFVILVHLVRGDVSSIDGVKTFASTTSSSSPENSDSFSILTKEFLNSPEGGEGGNRISQKPGSARANPARDNAIGATDNNLPDSDESGERREYFYDKPKYVCWSWIENETIWFLFFVLKCRSSSVYII